MKLFTVILVIGMSLNLRAEPPYSGTSFVDENIITDSDPTTFVAITYQGEGQRNMFDRRTNAFQIYTVHLFDVTYSDSSSVEFQVNNEFDQIEANEQATFYATAIGRIPAALKSMVETVWMHKGDEAFGGGNNNILIHTGSIAQSYIAGGYLEEVLVHESTHTSIDPAHALAPLWLATQQTDTDFISTYARDNPNREDMAESLLMYLAVIYRSDRISAINKAIIEDTIPNRISYISQQNFDFSLLESNGDDLIFRDNFEADKPRINAVYW